MTSYQAELTIDFGRVGYWNSTHPFRLRLEADALTELIADARNAHRVYELMVIQRPGDVWDYVSVMPEIVPQRVSDRVSRARAASKPPYGEDHPWPEGRLPFTAFDRLFYWAWDDTEPEDEAWLSHRNSETMRTFARQLFSIVRGAQANIDWNDHLLRHECARIRSGAHDYAFLDRHSAIARSRDFAPNPPTHSDGFYRKLDELLADAELASVAYRGNGDYRVLRMLCTEQRRRADRTGHDAEHALHLSASVNRKVNTEAWDARLAFFGEGLGHGDLYIEEAWMGARAKELIERSQRPPPGRYILSLADEGEIPGYACESGDGWTLYRRLDPIDRRRALELIQFRRSRSRLGRIMQFDGQGPSLFEYDKTVVVMGEQLPGPARVALASAIAEWQCNGGDPLVVVLGDERPFMAADCTEIRQPQQDLISGGTAKLSTWLFALLEQRRNWIDVAIMLDAPEWSAQALADYFGRREGLWKPWVIATPGLERLEVDLVLDGDVGEIITQAHRRARAMRPRPM